MNGWRVQPASAVVGSGVCREPHAAA